MGRGRGEGTWTRRVLVVVVGLAAFAGAVGAVTPAGASTRSAERTAAAAHAPEDPEPLEIDRSQERFDEAAEQAEGASDGAVEMPPGALDGQLSGTLAEQIAAAGGADEGATDEGGLTLVEDLDGDGEVSPPPPPEPEPQVEEQVPPAEPVTPGEGALGEVAELAKEVDVDAFEPGDEITELRTEESRTFVEEDGELRTEISTTPLHVADAQGDMVEIDPSLEGAPDQRWRPQATEAQVSFAPTADASSLGTIGFGPGRQVSWSLDGAADVPGTADDDAVSYDDVLDGVDMELQATSTGAKETLILADASAPTVYDFPLSVTGLEPVLEDPFGAVRFVEPDSDETVGVIPPAWAVDSSEGPRGESPDPVSLAYELVGGADDPVLRVTVNEDWLHDPARVFPVTVDPSLGNYTPSGDTYVDSSAAGSNFSTLGYLKMAGDSSHRRQYYSVWNLGLLSGTAIIGASYKTLNTYSYSCSPAYVGVFRLTSAWNPATVSWNSRPSFDSDPVGAPQSVSHGYSGSCPDDWIDFDVTNLVQTWVDGVNPNYGIAVRGAPGDTYDETVYKEFSSSEAAVGGQVLTIVWTQYRAAYAGSNPINELANNSLGETRVRVTNKSFLTWNAAGAGRYMLGYHVFKWNGSSWVLYRWDGLQRTPLPHDMQMESAWLDAQIEPLTPGDYLIKWDMLRETSPVTWFSEVGDHPDLEPMQVSVQVPNHLSFIEHAEPSGQTETRTPELQVVGINPDAWPSGGLEYTFRICADPAMTTDCVFSPWQTTPAWTPPDPLDWNHTYYWRAAVREAGSGGVTTPSNWKLALTPTVPQPELAKHFGSDANAPLHGGVNPSIGNYVASSTDISVASAGLPVELTRSYNSLDTRVGSFGPGWSSFLDTSVTVEGSGMVVVNDADGRRARYSRDPADLSAANEVPPRVSYAGPLGSKMRLSSWEKDGQPNDYRLIRPDGVTYRFDAQGSLIEVDDGLGHKLALHRDTSGRVDQVENLTSGRSLFLEWDDVGPDNAWVITEASTDPVEIGGQPQTPTWTYTYTAGGRLEQACPPPSGAACATSTGYQYYGSADGPGADGKLHRIVRPAGNDGIEIGYADNGHVAWTEDGLDNRWTYDDADDQAEGTYHPIDGWRVTTTNIGADATATVDVTGDGGVPATGVQAVVVDVGVDRPAEGGYLEAYPSDAVASGVSTMTYIADEPRSTLHTVAVGADGTIKVTNHGGAITADFDVVGWYGEAGVPDGNVFVPLPTKRILDTRLIGSGGPLAPEEIRSLPVTGVGGIPEEGVTAVVYNIEAIYPTLDTYISSFPSDLSTPPDTTSLWIEGGRLADNLAITKVGTDGEIKLYNRQGSTNLAIDVVGYFADPDLHEGNVFRPVTGQRLVDTRTTGGQWETPWKGGSTRPVMMAGVGTLPEQGLGAVVGEVQAVLPGADVGMRATPSGTTADGNTYIGQQGLSAGNHLYTGLGEDGAFDLWSSRNTEVVVDVFGYFTPLPRSVFITDPRQDEEPGHTLEYRYDSLGRLVGTIDQDGYETARAYNDDGFLLATIDATGTWLAYTYDDDGKVLSEQTAQLRPDWTIRWTSTKHFGYVDGGGLAVDGKLAWVADGRSTDRSDTTYRTNYTYNTAGQPLMVIGPATAAAPGGAGVTTTYTMSSTPAVEGGSAVAPAGLVETTTDAAGLVTRYRYDTKGDLREIWYPPQPGGSGPPTRRDVFTYDALGRVVTRTEHSQAFPDGSTTTIDYDAAGRVVKQTGPQLSNPVTGDYRTEATQTYTDNGLLLRSTVRDTGTNQARWSENSYDDADRLVGTVDSANRETSLTYDEAGNTATATAYDDTTLAYTYNGRGLVETITAEDVVHDPVTPSSPVDVELAAFGYDAVGRLITEVDAGGRLAQNMWRPDGQLQASVVGNVRNTDPDTGSPSGGERSVLVTGASLDRAGHPTDVYGPSDVSVSDSFDGPLGSEWIPDGGGWSVTDGELRASAGGQVRRTGGLDGSVSVTVGSTPPALPLFRKRDAAGPEILYHRLRWDGTNLLIERVALGVPTEVLGEGSLPDGLTAGDRVEAVFLGDRAWALVNGVVVADAFIGYNPVDSGYGISSTAAGEGVDDFRFDAFQRTRNTFDSYGRVTSSAFDPGGADVVTSTTRDAAGRPTKVTVAKGAGSPGTIAHTGYDSHGNLNWVDAEVEGGARRRTDYTFDDRGLMTAVETPEQSRTELTYDSVGQLTATEEPERSVQQYGQTPADVTPTTTYGYNAFGERTTEQDPAGRTSTFWFDGRGFPILSILPSYTPPGGTALPRSTSATYDDMGRVLTATDMAGETTDLTYNSLGQVVLQEDPAAGDDARGGWTYLYDDVGRVVEQEDPLGAISRLRWDDLDRTTGVEQIERYPSLTSSVAGFSYGNGGGLLRSRTAAGVVSTSTYDVAGRLLQSLDADGNATTYAYDDMMRPNQVTGPDNRSVKTFFDMAGDRVKQEFYGPAGGAALGSAEYTWDQDHRLLTARSPRGVAEDFATQYAYNAAGQIVSRTTPVGPGDAITEAWKYDELGQPTSYTDGRLNETWQTYNSMGLPEDTILPAAGTHTAVADRRWRTAYDAASRPVTQAAPGGASVTTTYDQLGRPTQESGAGAGASTETRMFDWDPVGRLESASTPTSNQQFAYYDSGLLRSSTGTSGDSSFEYDADGRLTQQIDSSGTLDIAYDDRALPESMTSTLAGDVDLTHDEAGRLLTVDYGSDTRRSFTYDAWGQIDTDVLSTTGTATPLYGVDYGYDLDGNITSKAVTGTGVPAAGTNTYTYDRASRITSWTRPGSSAAETYTWDKAGNRTGVGASTAQFDEQNRLTTVSGADGSTTSTWNADGTLDQQDVEPAARKVSLVVADPAGLSTADTALRDHFVAEGATVTLVDDAAAAPTSNVDVIVIAPSVDPATLAAKYKDVTIPVVTLASGTWQASGLTNGAPTTASGASAHVADPIHPVAAGENGTVTVLTSSDELAWAPAATVGSGARLVWAASSGSTDGVVTAYDTGSARPTSPVSAAPGRQVAVGFSAGAVGKLNVDGWAVVDAAVAWADDNPLVPVAGVTTFDFDAFEQLRTVTPPSPAAASTYGYDALGRRRTAASGPLTYAGMGIQPSSDGAYRYGFGVGGTIAVDDMSAGGGAWAHADGHTDVVGTFTPGATALSSAQTFSPWGQPMGATGSPLPLGYQAERTDLPGGLVPMGVREYNPQTGTFLSRDPANDPTVPNGYGYTPANPLGFTDPTGQVTCVWWWDFYCFDLNDDGGGDDVVTGAGCALCQAAGDLLSDLLQPKKKKHRGPQAGTGGSHGSVVGGSSGSGSGSGGGPGSGPGHNPRPTNCSGPCGGRPPGSAEAPPPPTSNLEWQVAGGQPAIPNYPGRVQRDRSNGEIVDTGLSGHHGPSDAHVTVDTGPVPAAPSAVAHVVSSPNRPPAEGGSDCGFLDCLGDAAKAFADDPWGSIGDVWDATRDAVTDCVDDPGACVSEIGHTALEVGKTGLVIAVGVATSVGCGAVTMGSGGAACVAAGFAAAGAVQGALDCPEGQSIASCTWKGGVAGAAAGLGAAYGCLACAGALQSATSQYLNTGEINMTEVVVSAVVFEAVGRGTQRVSSRLSRRATTTSQAAPAPGPVSETPVVIRPSGSTGDGVFTPGPHAGQSIPARGPQQSFNVAERSAINDIGATTGCHRCGATVSGRSSGNFTPDHQPPVAMNPSGAPMRLYPHCAVCSRQQGGFVSSWLARFRSFFGR